MPRESLNWLVEEHKPVEIDNKTSKRIIITEKVTSLKQGSRWETNVTDSEVTWIRNFILDKLLVPNSVSGWYTSRHEDEECKEWKVPPRCCLWDPSSSTTNISRKKKQKCLTNFPSSLFIPSSLTINRWWTTGQLLLLLYLSGSNFLLPPLFFLL